MSRASLLVYITSCLAASAAPAGGQAPASAAPITLAEARQRAETASPALLALTAEQGAIAGAARQARALDNPELSLEIEDFGADRARGLATQRTLAVSQTVEWFGKRSARVRAADSAAEVAAVDRERARRQLLADVDRAFALLLGAQERAVIAAQNRETARDVTRAVASLVEAGEVSPVEEARARSDEALAGIDLANATRDVDLAQRDLALLWGDDAPPPFAAAGTLATAVPLPDRDAVLARLATLPDLARWDAEVARQASLVALAERRALPDLTLSVGTRSNSGLAGRSYVAAVAFPVPLLDRFAGGRAEASALRQRAVLDRRTEEVRLTTAFLATYATLARAQDEADALRNEVLPMAVKVYEALEEGYRRGKFGLLDLLEARRTLAAARLRYVDALLRLNTADAELRRYLPDGLTYEDGAQR